MARRRAGADRPGRDRRRRLVRHRRPARADGPGQPRRARARALMPELPEVERARALIEERALGRRIADVDDTDDYVCRPHSAGEIAGALVGRSLVAARRRGKTMWTPTDGDPV